MCGLVKHGIRTEHSGMLDRNEFIAWVITAARKKVYEGSWLRQLLGATPFEDREMTSEWL